MNTDLLEKLKKVERLAKGPKILRFLHHPGKYIFALGWRHIVHRFRKKGFRMKTKTFWNESFTVELPAATDIFLTGAKSDESETRLAKYLIRTLKPGDQFIDVGSHFGYYSCLALQLTGPKGQSISIEPSDSTFEILKLNLQDRPNAISIKAMAGEKTGQKEFYQFPNLYSEYNTAHPGQFSNTEWFKKSIHHRTIVPLTTLDEIISSHQLSPCVIKIDAEGSEWEVIKGALETLHLFPQVILAMEFLSKGRSNDSHTLAAEILKENGFMPNVILENGILEPCKDIETHLSIKNIESDNIIFQRK